VPQRPSAACATQLKPDPLGGVGPAGIRRFLNAEACAMRLFALSLLVLLLLVPVVSFGGPPEPKLSERERGEYLVTIMDCGGCHTPGSLAGRNRETPLAGSLVGIGVPGDGGESPAVVYPANLTPDPATGLGKWSSEQIIRAIRYGQRPDGRMLSPVMPWPQ
jgi:hypothetical protein